MQCFTEIIPPTAVTHAVTLAFTGPQAQNLIVAKTSLLQIFSILAVTASSSLEQNETAEESPELVSQDRLKLIAEFPVAGTVTSLASIKAAGTKSGGEALLVALKDAKMTLLEWDPEEFNISTTSIHYYEGEDLQGSPWVPDLGDCSSFIAVDPSSRCAALKFGLRHLAILPFRQSDDLVMDDYDADLDEPSSNPNASSNVKPNDGKHHTPYSASFVLPLTALDPSLLQPVDLAFLYEYREPTLGVLSSSQAVAMSLLHERKDILSYTVFTLDLEQQARTPLLTVPGLPSDLFRIVPLPLPVGGSLLVGTNELIHIDQSGKPNGLSVNEFAKKCSSFPMADQSSLQLRLEGCTFDILDNATGDMLMVCSNGVLALLSFRLDGRSMTGLSLKPISTNIDGQLSMTATSCSSTIHPGLIFLGSEEGDSILIRCKRKAGHLSRKKSRVELAEIEDAISEDDDDDDLYATGITNDNNKDGLDTDDRSKSGYNVMLQDVLPGMSPNSAPAIGKKLLQPDADTTSNSATLKSLELILPSGRANRGRLNLLNQEVQLMQQHQLDLLKATDAWCLRLQSTFPDGSELDNDAALRDIVITSNRESDGSSGTSAIHEITSDGAVDISSDSFDTDSATLDAVTTCNGTRLVQVRPSELQIYGSNLEVLKAIPMADDGGTAVEIAHTSISKKYALVIRQDGSALVHAIDTKGDFKELDRGETMRATRWVAGSIYDADETYLLYLLSANGRLQIFELPDLNQSTYMADSAGFLPPRISAGPVPRRSPTRDDVMEMLVADLGSSGEKSPYLLIRTADGSVTIYQPYHYPERQEDDNFTESLKWAKIADRHVMQVQSDEYAYQTQMRAIPHLSGFSVVLVSGSPSRLIIKERSGLPNLFAFDSEMVRSISGCNTSGCANGVAHVDKHGTVYLSRLRDNVDYRSPGWTIRQFPLEQEVDRLCYHAPSELYVLGIAARQEFKITEDDWHHEWAKEDTQFLPENIRGRIALFHASTGTIIDEVELDQDERVLCIDSINLEVSEETHEQKQHIAVGTGIIRGEDLMTNGCIYIFEILSVVAWPDRPETGRKLKLIVKEEVKGAVTAISSVGQQGYALAVQGQKCMARGLKDDGGLLPVAFMDMQCYVTDLKNLKGTGLVLMADAVKGVWFSGFSEQPYRLSLLGKSSPDTEAITTEFLPYEKQLSILVADANCDLQILEFNPDDPKSLAGQRLLRKSTFHIGHFPTSMTLLPTTLSTRATANDIDGDDITMGDDTDERDILYQVLVLSQTGAISLLTPLDENSYRCLNALQTHLTNVTDFPGGLNPRAYRAVESEGFGGRGVLDGALLRRWTTLSSQRRQEACAKAGAEAWQIRRNLEIIGGAGLRYI